MALGSATGAFDFFTSDVNSFIGFASFLDTSSYKKKQVKLQQQQLGLDMEAAYRSSLDQLYQLGEAYDTTKDLITQANSQLDSANEWLRRYGHYYGTQMRQTFESGLGQYQALLGNWQNQQVISAERGQTGSTASLLSAMQRQSLVNYAGEDLVLDAEGGTYGDVLQEQMLDMAATRQTMVNNMGIVEKSITELQDAQSYYYKSFQDALGQTLKQGHAVGQTYDDLSKKIDEYREYFSATDSEYAKIKENLLKEWKPLDFEIKTITETVSRGGEESQHGSNDFNKTIYQIIDKATGKDATQEQIDVLLRNYAGNLKEKDWYGGGGYWDKVKYGNSYGLSGKAIEAIIKNSNYNKRKDLK